MPTEPPSASTTDAAAIVNPRPVRFTAANHLRLLLRVDRTLAIQRALAVAITPGARVLDAGCGSGLLSFLALKAGAAAVVAVDRDHVDLARELARANGCAERIRFLEGDLGTLDAETVPGRFDALLSFVYTNHIIVDEPQSRIVAGLRRRFGGPGCVTVPNRVRYTAMPCEWPRYDVFSELADLRRSVSEIEHRYDLRLGPLLDSVRDEMAFARSRPNNSGDHEWSPGASNGGYRHRRDGVRFLADPSPVTEIAYDVGPPFERLPPLVDLAVAAAGTLNAVLWTQELWYADHLIWTAESVSGVAEPLAVRAGDRLTLHLDEVWRATNTVRATPAAGAGNAAAPR